MKTKIGKKVLPALLSLLLLIGLIPTAVFAAEEKKPTREKGIWMYEDGNDYSQTIDMLDSEGWKWEPTEDGGIFTLRDCYIRATGTAIGFPYGGEDPATGEDIIKNITLVLEGENILETTENYYLGIISDTSARGSLNLTIKEGEKNGSLKLLSSGEPKENQNPYGMSLNSVTIESGTIDSNVKFCNVKNGDFKMTGGSLTVNIDDKVTDGDAITTLYGNVVIDGGYLEFNVGRVGIWAMGVTGKEPSNTRNVTINGGTVVMNAGLSGIYTQPILSQENTCDVSFTGGDIDITAGGTAIIARNITIDSTGKVKVHGNSAALYVGTAGMAGKIEINKAAKLALTGNMITNPAQSSTDGLKQIIIAKADYAEVEAAENRANALNPDLYVDFSAVTTALNAVDKTKNLLAQAEVNDMAKAINDAIDALELKGANFANLQAAIDKANALNKDNYEDFSKVEAAVNAAWQAIEEDWDITQQDEVNAMAKAINDAIDALELKGANFANLQAAIDKANALNKDNYEDFSKVEAAVNAAWQAIEEDWDITQQDEVNAMAKAINDAIDALELKGANFGDLQAAIDKANALNKDNYKDFSKVEAAVNTALQAMEEGRDITQQDEVNAMAKAVTDAINALDEKPADTPSSTPEDTPSTPNDDPANGNTPQTGDNSNMTLCVSLLFVSLGGAIGTTVYARKRRYNR